MNFMYLSVGVALVAMTMIIGRLGDASVEEINSMITFLAVASLVGIAIKPSNKT